MSIYPKIVQLVIAPLWARWEGSSYIRDYQRLKKTQYDDPEVIKDRQLDRLKKICKHAKGTIPFWHHRFAASGFDPENLSRLADIEDLPILTKKELREYTGVMESGSAQLEQYHRLTTSGSTGTAVTVYRDDACQQFKRGATLRCDEWTGWSLGEPIASVWGNPQIRTDWKGKIRRHLLERTYAYLDTLSMDEAAMAVFTKELIAQPPSLLFGHAHSLYLFASYVNQRTDSVKIRPKGVLSTCMVLHDFERERIEQVFQCPVINRYGCEEVSLIASECEKGEGLHVNSDCLLVEIIDNQGRSCGPGMPGRVIVTDLWNRAMPIIRYEVGDMAVWSEKSCSCGRTLPMLSSIEGRVADYVVTKSGKFISGISLTENFAVKIPGVDQMQIIQEEVDSFTFKIVKGQNFNEESLTVLAQLSSQFFGDDVRYEPLFVDEIPQEPSGKYRFCISKVSHSFE